MDAGTSHVRAPRGTGNAAQIPLALPAVLERTGYTFRYPDLDPALDDVAATLSPTRR